MTVRSWDVPGGPGSWGYRWFDAARRALNRRLVRWLAAHALRRRDAVVLEAGAGPAFGSSLFARHPGIRMSVALDLDPAALRQARRRDPGLPVVIGDLRRLPFRPGSVDLVWNSSTLEHLDDPAAALAEMRRVARPGGCVFTGVPYRFGPLGFQPWIASTRLGVWLGPVFDRRALVRLASAQGLVPERTMTYGIRCFLGVLLT